MRLKIIKNKELFVSGAPNPFPRKLWALVDTRPYTADVDIVISTMGDVAHMRALVENYLLLERRLKVHIWLVMANADLASFLLLPSGPQVSKVIILNNTSDILGLMRVRLAGSMSASLGAQVGQFFAASPYLFYSHEDMMATRENFLSGMMSMLDQSTPLASFSQRGTIPFSGGMLMRRCDIDEGAVDWLPLTSNPFNVDGLDRFKDKIGAVSWVDTGEQFIYRALERGMKAYIYESRGGSKGHDSDIMKEVGITLDEVKESRLGVIFAPACFRETVFRERQPHLVDAFEAPWRKSYDESGGMVFIHRGRGTTQRMGLQRGDFTGFLKEFNHGYKSRV
jgi:hypothetical protein